MTTQSGTRACDWLGYRSERYGQRPSLIGHGGIVSKRVTSRYRSGPSRSWLKTKKLVESEFIASAPRLMTVVCHEHCWLGNRMARCAMQP
jgi:hypothetical protein